MSARGRSMRRFGVLASVFAVALAASGALLAHLEAAAPMVGFVATMVGTAFALIAACVVIIGAVRERHLGWGALAALGADVLLVLIVVAAALQGRGLPRINDITTDVKDPREFVAASELEANEGHDLSYDPSFAEHQRSAYEDVATIRIDAPAPEALGRALAVARELGWDVHSIDRQGLAFEATDRSWLFRFVDDIVVRVKPVGQSSMVDVRSKSRDGRGDFGVNAERIRAFTGLLVER